LLGSISLAIGSRKLAPKVPEFDNVKEDTLPTQSAGLAARSAHAPDRTSTIHYGALALKKTAQSWNRFRIGL